MTDNVFSIEDAIIAITKYTEIVEEYIITLGGAVQFDNTLEVKKNDQKNN